MKLLRITQEEKALYKEILHFLETNIHFLHVSHVNIIVKNYNGKEEKEQEYKLNNSNLFIEDYSFIIKECKHTGIELLHLWNNIDISKTSKDKINELITYLDDEDNIAEYVKRTDSAFDALEDFFKSLSYLMTQEREGTFNGFLVRPFRNFKKPNKDKDYMIPISNASIKNIFFTLKKMRNDNKHANESVFVIPRSKKDNENKDIIDNAQYTYCNNVKSLIILFVLIIMERFYDELVKITFTEDMWYNIHSSFDENAINILGKEVLGTKYMPYILSETKTLLKESFRGVALYEIPETIFSELPELKLCECNDDKKQYDNEHIADNIDHSVIIGPPGSGKSIMIYQMIIYGKVHLLPVYINASDIKENINIDSFLKNKIVSGLNFCITPEEKICCIERVMRLKELGEIVIFIDGIEPDTTSINKLTELIESCQKCKIICTIQNEDLNPFIEVFKKYGFTQFDICPIEREQSLNLMRLYSQYISKVDHSQILENKIRIATDGLSIMSNPLSLNILIHLFETKQDLKLHSINRTQLYHTMIKNVERNNNIDEEEKEILLNQDFIIRFKNDINSIRQLRDEILTHFKNEDIGKIISTFNDCQYLQSESKIITLFEMLELFTDIDSNNNTNNFLFQTLITDYVLGYFSATKESSQTLYYEDGMIVFPKNTLFTPSANLIKFAHTLRTINYKRPSVDNIDINNASILYRLSPKYILESYICNFLLIYQDYDFESFQDIISDLFKVAAIISTPRVIDMLFEIKWLQKWAIHHKDIIEELDVKGYSEKNNILARVLIDNTTDYTTLIYKMIPLFDFAEAMDMTRTKDNLSEYISEIISEKMNDEQLERFISEILPKVSYYITSKKISYWKNLAISSMDSLSLADNFEDINMNLPGQNIQDKLVKMGNKTEALKLLFLWFKFTSAYTNNINHISRIADVFKHLIKYKAHTIPEIKDMFWNNLKSFLYTKEFSKEISKLLDIIPINEFPLELASELYDHRIVSYQIQVAKEHDLSKEKWIESQSLLEADWVFKTIALNNDFNKQITYSLYSKHNDSTFVLASECINEMPEGKFCRIKGLDQWFSVQDVQDLEIEHKMEYIVHVILHIKTWAPRPNKGNIRININEFGLTIPYINLYENLESDIVAIRIEDVNAVNILRTKKNIKCLKNERTCQFNGDIARIIGVDIKPVNPNTRLIWIHPVRNDDHEYSKQIEKISSIPDSGVISFFHSKRKGGEARYSELGVKILSDESRAQSKSINEIVYISSDDKSHYFAVKIPLTSNQWLIPNDKGWKACVEKTHDIRIKQDGNMESPQKLIDHLWKLHKSDSKYKKYYYIIRTKIIGQKPQFKRDKEYNINAKVAYYEPFSQFAIPEFKQEALPLVTSSVPGKITNIEGIDYIEVPQTNYPENAKFFKSKFMPSRTPVVWNKMSTKDKLYIEINPSILHLWKTYNEGDISFYVDRGVPTPINISFSSPVILINLKEENKYHNSIVGLLIKEWAKKDCISQEEISFCINKSATGLLIKFLINRISRGKKVPWMRVMQVICVADKYIELFEGVEDLNSYHTKYSRFKFNNTQKGINEGDLVIYDGYSLYKLSKQDIDIIASRGLWGFHKGKLTKNKKYYTVEVEGSNNYFYVNKTFTNYKEGDYIMFFPTIPPASTKQKYCVADYIRAIK